MVNKKKNNILLIILFPLLSIILILFKASITEARIYIPFLLFPYVFFFRVNFEKIDYIIIVPISLVNDIFMDNILGFTLIALFITDFFLSRHKRFIVGHRLFVYCTAYFLSVTIFLVILGFLRKIFLDYKIDYFLLSIEIFISILYYVPIHLIFDKYYAR